MRIRTIAFLGAILLVSSNMFGQTVSSNLVGIVTDPANAVIPGAAVQLTSDATGEIRNASSNELGLFRFVDLQAGSYTTFILTESGAGTPTMG